MVCTGSCDPSLPPPLFFFRRLCGELASIAPGKLVLRVKDVRLRTLKISLFSTLLGAALTHHHLNWVSLISSIFIRRDD